MTAKAWPGDWVVRAACRGLQIEIFFPRQGGSLRRARRICQGCPVREDCHEYGADEREGIWGGVYRGRSIPRAPRPRVELPPVMCQGVCGQMFTPRSSQQKYCTQRCGELARYAAHKRRVLVGAA